MLCVWVIMFSVWVMNVGLLVVFFRYVFRYVVMLVLVLRCLVEFYGWVLMGLLLGMVILC